MAIKIEMLRTFRAVVQHGSLTNAAEALGRTPSAVSMMLRQFEENVGAPLFESGRKARLTSLGQMVDDIARREIEHFNRTVEAIEGLSRAQSGLVRLAVTPSLGQSLAPGVIAAFRRDHPGVRIELRDMTTAEIHAALRADAADIGLASDGPLPGFEGQVLLSDPFGVVCHSEHELARDWDRLTWSDLVGVEFIENGLCGQITDAAFGPVLAGARLVAPNTSSLLALVRAGMGTTVLPQLAVPPSDRSLAFLPLVDTSARREVWLLAQPEDALSPAASALHKSFAEIQSS